MKLYQKGKDWTGYYWWIKLWGNRGFTINWGTSGIEIGVSIDISWAEECGYIALRLFNLCFIFFPEVDWD